MKRVLLILTVISMLFLCACGVAGNTAGDPTVPSTLNETEDPSDVTGVEATTVPVELSEEDIYNQFLVKLATRLNKIIGDDTYLDGLSAEEGMLGVSEIAMHGGIDLLEKIGYTILDINDDGVPELLVCSVDEIAGELCNGTMILCAYTVKDNEQILLFEGWGKNRYYLLEDMSVYNEGSDGAAYTIFGTYSFEQGNSTLTCTDYYFTDVDENQNVLFYNNQTATNDAAVSTPFAGDEAAFWNVQKSMASGIRTIDLLPMSTLVG